MSTIADVDHSIIQHRTSSAMGNDVDSMQHFQAPQERRDEHVPPYLERDTHASNEQPEI